MAKLPKLIMRDAKIGYRNFAGKESKYNPAGKRNFCIFLDEELARKLMEDGWNVRIRGEEGEQEYYISVNVSYNKIPPRIFIVTKSGKTEIFEETVHILDYSEIVTVDLTVSPYLWEVGGKGGVKGYLSNMYVTVFEDELADTYRDVPTLNQEHGD